MSICIITGLVALTESHDVTGLEEVVDDISLRFGRESSADEDTSDDGEDKCSEEEGLEDAGCQSLP
jgi:hypothetical protein